MNSETSFTTYLNNKIQWIDAYLQASFPILPMLIHSLQESMQYSLFAKGKRLRPILLLETFECCGGIPEKALPFAASIEFIHTYSLIHDDLPCMDDDDLRRGLPTNHIRFGEAMALLAGDGLLTHAFQLISNPELLRHFSGDVLLHAIHGLATGAGLFGMVGGQAADIHRENGFEDKERLDFIHSLKTGALITAAIEIGAILADVDVTTKKLFIEFGKNIGKSFQIQDDILDEIGDTENLGKPVGSDQKNDKLTYPQLYGLEKSKTYAESYYAKAMEALAHIPHNTSRLEEIARFIIHRKV